MIQNYKPFFTIQSCFGETAIQKSKNGGIFLGLLFAFINVPISNFDKTVRYKFPVAYYIRLKVIGKNFFKHLIEPKIARQKR